MKDGIQTLMAEAGEAACYALAIIEIAERVTGKKIDPMDTFYRGIDRGYIYYNENNQNDNDNFFIKDPVGLLSLLSGGKWAFKKVDRPEYTPETGEYVVDRWERRTTGKTTGHFRLPDWDSLKDSQTVKYGQIVSKRVFKKTG